MSTALEIGATVGTADAGKSVARVAAVQIALYDLLDDQPEKTVLPLETTLILGQKALGSYFFLPPPASSFLRRGLGNFRRFWRLGWLCRHTARPQAFLDIFFVMIYSSS